MFLPSEKTDAPLTKHYFTKIWNANSPTLRITKPGGDFRETCPKIGKKMQTTVDEITRDALSGAKRIQRDHANVDFKN